MGGLRERITFFLSHARESCAQRLGSVNGGRIAQPSEPISDSGGPDSKSPSDSLLSNAALVEPDNLVLIKRKWIVANLATRKAEPDEVIADSVASASEVFSKLRVGKPGGPKPEKLVGIDREWRSTHVYNLRTIDNWYYAGDIVTHNCRHSWMPFFPGIMEQTDHSYLDGRDSELDYELSQRQRLAERNIREYQGRANAYSAAARASGDATLKAEAARNSALATKWRSEADRVSIARGGARRRAREAATPTFK